MVETLPPLTYGKIVGRYLAAVADTGADGDVYPDAMPMQGTITFTPSVPSLKVATATPVPTTVLVASITGTLDASGYLTLNGVAGVYLIATNDAATNPTGFTYKVTFDLYYPDITTRYAYGPLTISVPAGSTQDLTTVAG